MAWHVLSGSLAHWPQEFLTISQFQYEVPSSQLTFLRNSLKKGWQILLSDSEALKGMSLPPEKARHCQDMPEKGEQAAPDQAEEDKAKAATSCVKVEAPVEAKEGEQNMTGNVKDEEIDETLTQAMENEMDNMSAISLSDSELDPFKDDGKENGNSSKAVFPTELQEAVAQATKAMAKTSEGADAAAVEAKTTETEIPKTKDGKDTLEVEGAPAAADAAVEAKTKVDKETEIPKTKDGKDTLEVEGAAAADAAVEAKTKVDKETESEIPKTKDGKDITDPLEVEGDGDRDAKTTESTETEIPKTKDGLEAAEDAAVEAETKVAKESKETEIPNEVEVGVGGAAAAAAAADAAVEAKTKVAKETEILKTKDGLEAADDAAVEAETKVAKESKETEIPKTDEVEVGGAAAAAAADAAVEAKTEVDKETEIPKTKDGLEAADDAAVEAKTKVAKESKETEIPKTTNEVEGAAAAAAAAVEAKTTESKETEIPKTKDGKDQNQKPLVAPVMPAPANGPGGLRKRWMGQQNDSEVLNEHHRSGTETQTQTQTKGKGKRSTKSNSNKGLEQFFNAGHFWGSGPG